MINILDLKTMCLISEQELRARHPLISFSANLQGHHLEGTGYAEVVYTQQPQNQFTTCLQGPHEERDGKWYTTWIQSPLPIKQCQNILLNKIVELRRNVVRKDVVIDNVRIQNSESTIIALTMIANGSISADFKGLDGWLKLQPSDAKQILDTINAQIQAGFSNEKRHYDAIMAIEKIDDIMNYDITTGC
jgi:hypothetical protein